METNKQWTHDLEHCRAQKTRHPVTFINAHDVESTFSAKAFVKILTKDEKIATRAILGPEERRKEKCLLCLCCWRSNTSDSFGAIMVHLSNV